ncbi:PKD domain-containing protein [Catenovulum sp. SX2]|uniref:PKD domain-containing protein n=1 Tax=Catenovulum sp. SX2 TaxID=3398614 RepID=UPI003F846F51
MGKQLEQFVEYMVRHKTQTLFALDANNSALFAYDITTGKQISKKTFDFTPSRMQVSDDKQTIYVVVVEEFADYNVSGTSHLHAFKVDTLEKINSYSLPFEMRAFAMFDNNRLIAEKGDYNGVVLFDLATGLQIGQRINQYSIDKIVKKSDSQVYLFDYSSIILLNVTASGLQQVSDSYTYWSSSNAWVLPNFEHAISRYGDVYSLEAGSIVSSISVQNIVDVSVDESQNLVAITSANGSVTLLNAESNEAFKVLTVAGEPIIYTMDQYFSYAVTLQGGKLYTVKQNHPCLSCSTNTTPVANYTYTPSAGDTGETYVFDASSTVDADNNPLTYRWDINNDGVWETAYSSQVTFEHRFPLAGSKFVKLGVKDQFGAVAEKVLTFDVAQGITSPIAITDATANQFDFSASYAVFDQQRQLAYVLSVEDKKVIQINLQTGMAEQYLPVYGQPRAISIDPSNQTLFVISAETNSYCYSDGLTQYIAKIDLSNFSEVKLHPTHGCIEDIDAVTKDLLVISDDSNNEVIALDFSQDEVKSTTLDVPQVYSSHVLVDAANNQLLITGWREVNYYTINGNQVSLSSTVSLSESIDDVAIISDLGNYVASNYGEIFTKAGFSRIFQIDSNISYSAQRAVAFDDANSLVFAHTDSGVISYFNTKGQIELDALTFNSNLYPQNMAIIGEKIYLLANNNNSGSQLVTFDHPCTTCGISTEPMADFTYTPASMGTTADEFEFNASASSDAEDDATKLQYRWDIDNDGEWDSEFLTTASFKHKFFVPGSKSVKLQVRDSSGLTAEKTLSFSIEQGQIAATAVTDSTANLLDYTPTDTLLEPSRGKIFNTDAVNNRLYTVDLATGKTESYFDFAYKPESLALSNDNNTLYVSLAVQEHSPYWWDEDQYGYIAVIDLTTNTLINSFKINVDPYDIAITKDNRLLVSPGSGQWGDLHMYNPSTGSEVTSAGSIYHLSSILLNEQKDKAVVYDHNSIDVFSLSSSSISQTSGYISNYYAQGFAQLISGGSHMVNALGQIAEISDFSVVAQLDASYSSAIVAVAEDTTNGLLFVLKGSELITYNTSSWLEISRQNVVQAEWVSFYNDKLYIIENSFGSYSLSELDHPCADCANNTIPDSVFTYTPEVDGTTADTYVFDGSNSQDADDDDVLQYRWDVDGDGVWDSEFLTSTTYEHQYLLNGSYVVSLQVKDSKGYTHISKQTVTVAFGALSGQEINDSPAYHLSGNLQDAVYVEATDTVYYISPEDNTVYLMNFSDVQLTKSFQLAYPPEAITMSPDGTKVYVAMIVQAHSCCWQEDEQYGYIAVFDTASESMNNLYRVNIDPFDILVDSRNKLYISSGSGQWTNFNAYNAETGSLIAQSFIRHRSYIAMHPTENWIFAADTDLSPSDIEKFTISGSGTSSIIAAGDSPYHGDYRMSGGVWTSADGTYVITRGGDIFLASDMTYVQGLTGSGVRIRDAVFNLSEKRVTVATDDGYATTYSTEDWSEVSSTFVDQYANLIKVIENQTSGKRLVFSSVSVTALD